MNIARTIAKFSLIAILGVVILLPATLLAQTSATKRKVKDRILPDYPPVARQMNITGKVKIQAVVEPDGHVKSTHAVGGSPLLIQAAERALKEWKFEPGPKETTEVVEFDFTGQQ